MQTKIVDETTQEDFYQEICKRLSKRQMEVLYLLLSGFSVKMIARFLEISPETAKTHLNFIKGKLRVSSNLEVVYLCFIHQLAPRIANQEVCVSGM